MKTINRFFHEYTFEDKDPNFDYFNQLVEMENKNELSRLDFNVITSMFRLHKDLPSLPEALFDNGFILPKNEKSPGGNVDATWEYEKKGEKRTLSYTESMWDTMWNRSDHHHVDIEYKTEDLKATYRYRNCETDYGRSKERERHCLLEKDGKVIIDYVKPF